jgi:hypothetical protein
MRTRSIDIDESYENGGKCDLSTKKDGGNKPNGLCNITGTGDRFERHRRRSTTLQGMINGVEDTVGYQL